MQLKRRKRFLLSALLLLLLASMTVLVVNVCRPHYRTYFPNHLIETNLSVSVEVSDEWKPDPLPSWYSGPPTVSFGHTPPRGLARWWQEHILRQDMQQWKYDHLSVTLEGPWSDGMDGMEQYYRQERPQTTLHRFHHPLGSALEVSRQGYRAVAIFPNDKRARIQFYILLSMDTTEEHYVRLHAALSHMIESVRLVDK